MTTTLNHGDTLPLSRCSAESYPISQSQILRSELGVEEEPDEALYLYFCLLACGPLFLAIPECSYSTLAVLRTSFRPQEIESANALYPYLKLCTSDKFWTYKLLNEI
eukprot:scaffold8186_cov132-Skeletonema_dohrnii-CCMP3373.AAC.1